MLPNGWVSRELFLQVEIGAKRMHPSDLGIGTAITTRQIFTSRESGNPGLPLRASIKGG